MTEDVQKMESADLEVRLNYSQGGGDEAVVATLVLLDRKSNLTVAQIDFSAADLVNFLARRVTGSFEGKTLILGEGGRPHLNRKRHMVSVRVPNYVVTILKDEPNLKLPEWADSAARAYGAHSHRITSSRGSCTVSLMFYAAGTEREISYLQVVQNKLNDAVAKYIDAADERKAAL